MRLPTASNRTILIAAGAVALAVASAAFIKKEQSISSAVEPIPFLLSDDNSTTGDVNPEGEKDVATLVLELFNPSDKILTKQLNETNVRQQVEQLMATGLVLMNCKLITENDYKRTYKAAIAYAIKNNLATDNKSGTAKVYSITKSAGASYAMIYSRTKCDDPKLATIKQQLHTWVAAYLPHDPRTAGLEPD